MSSTTSAYTTTVKDWKEEVKALMKNFGFDKNEINYVLESAKSEFKETTTELQKFNIAWRKFYTMSCMTHRERNAYMS